MNRRRIIWNEFIYGGHLLSIGASSIVYVVSKLLDSPISWDFLVIAYLGIQASYLFNRYREFEQDLQSNPERTQHLSRYIKTLPYQIVLFIAGLFLIMYFQKKMHAAWFTLIPLSIGILYSIFLKDLTAKIPGFKTFVVAFGWALYAPFYVVYYQTDQYNIALLLITFFIFIRWVINTSFFDLKDIASDGELGLKTLPVLLGQRKFFNFLQFFNFISLLPLSIGIISRNLPIFGSSLFLVPLTTAFFLWAVRKRADTLNGFYYILADSEFLLWGIIIWISTR